MEKILNFSKKIILEKRSRYSLGVDATCGRGHDTLFLSSICDFVYAFDVQQYAIDSTKELLATNKVDNVNVILDSHENFDKYINDDIDVVMFNLGYLPNGNKSLTTKSEITLSTIKKFISNLKLGGLISIVLYPGHEEGLIESNIIEEYLHTIDQHQFDIIKYEFINQINYPPFVIILERIK